MVLKYNDRNDAINGIDIIVLMDVKTSFQSQ